METLFSFIFLTLSILSLWIKRSPKIWGSFLALSLLLSVLAGNILWIGLFFLAAVISLWLLYVKKPSFLIFVALAAITLCYKIHIIPGYVPVYITPKFRIGLEMAILGLLPLALVVPLAKTVKDWKKVLKGFGVGCLGIAILAILAKIGKVTQLEFKLPSFFPIRYWSNLILTSIPEEGFYRGFLQTQLSRYFGDTKWGKIGALLLTSVIFTSAHIYWSPNIAVLSFVFLASLLYGGVYLISGKIESAILCHFLLNFIHMTFFNYHAM